MIQYRVMVSVAFVDDKTGRFVDPPESLLPTLMAALNRCNASMSEIGVTDEVENVAAATAMIMDMDRAGLETESHIEEFK